MQAGPNTHQNVDSVAPGYNPWTGGDGPGGSSDCNLTGGVLADLEVRLVVGGVPAGDNKAVPGAWPTPDAYGAVPPQVYGGAADSWGLTLTPEIVNAPNFGIAVRVQDTTDDNSEWLVLTNYGFNVVPAATNIGVEAALHRGDYGGGHAAVLENFLTVHYE